MLVGHVEANQVLIGEGNTEAYHAIPSGSLTDEASMLSYAPDGACFGVTLRSLDSNWTDVSSFDISLEADGQPLPEPTFDPQQPTAQSFNGLVPEQRQTGTETVCTYTDARTQICGRWETRPVYTTVMVPGILTVTTGGGRLCFGNNGAITPSTNLLALEFANTGIAVQRFVFEWELVGDPPAQPAQPQVFASQ